MNKRKVRKIAKYLLNKVVEKEYQKADGKLYVRIDEIVYDVESDTNNFVVYYGRYQTPDGKKDFQYNAELTSISDKHSLDFIAGVFYGKIV